MKDKLMSAYSYKSAKKFQTCACGSISPAMHISQSNHFLQKQVNFIILLMNMKIPYFKEEKANLNNTTNHPGRQ